MANTRFYLKDNSAAGATRIILAFSYGKRIRLSTGISVAPKDWSNNKQKVRGSVTGSVDINARLAEMKSNIEKIYSSAVAKHKRVTNTYLKEAFYSKNEDTASNKLPSFKEYFHIYYKRAAQRLKPSSMKAYKSLLKNLEEYEAAKSTKIEFDNIDLSFYDSFQAYCYQKGLSVNYFGNLIKILKVILNAGTEEGINTNLAFRSRKFKKTSEKVRRLYLNEEEIQRLYAYDFSDKPNLEKVRDFFIVGCMTGLRFQDVCNIREENIKDGMLRIMTQKTNTLIQVPIKEDVQRIFNKYNKAIGQPLPKPFTNQTTNRYLKQVGRWVGLDKTKERHITKGGTQQSVLKKQYELLATHTARRSFATNAYKAGVSTIAIMQITGHKTEAAFLRYINVGEEENAQRLQGHSFFQ